MKCGVTLDLVLNVPEDRLELVEFVVIQAVINDESDRHHREHIETPLLIEFSHVEEQVLLIAQALIALNLVVYSDARRRIALLLDRVLSVRLSHVRLLIGLEAIDVSLLDPLRPDKVALVKSIFLPLVPPGASLEDLLYQHVVVSSTYEVFVGALGLILSKNRIRNPIRTQYMLDEESIHLFPNKREKVFLLGEGLHLMTELFGDLKVEVSCASIENLLLNRIKFFKTFEQKLIQNIHHLNGPVYGMLCHGLIVIVSDLRFKPSLLRCALLLENGSFPTTATRIGIDRDDIFKPRLLIEQLLKIGNAANLRELLLLLAHPLVPVL